jgi:hypothetical protein
MVQARIWWSNAGHWLILREGEIVADVASRWSATRVRAASGNDPFPSASKPQGWVEVLGELEWIP